jgi:hypothetical protein
VGDELCFVLPHRGVASRAWALGLTIKGTDTVIDVRGEFSREAVREACLAHGWRRQTASQLAGNAEIIAVISPPAS